jgi:cell division protein FtsZ
MAKELDILTVGIVTMPFQFEGKLRNEQAQKGVETLRAHVDSLVVINNNKLREVYGNLGFKAGFSKADEVLSTASRGIAEVITHHYTQNIDLRDAKTVLSNSGTAIMGSATAAGKSRAQEAIMSALDSPLLNDNKITGAKNVLLLIVSGTHEITIDEIGEINDHIQNEAGHGANIIMGVGEDESLQESISVTIIATGFNIEQQDEISNTEVKKVVHALEDDQNNQDVYIKEREPAIITPDIILEKEEEKVVRHTLFEEEKVQDTFVSEAKNEDVHSDIIPTTEFIRNLNVIYDEVQIHELLEEDDFIITPIQEFKEEPKPVFEDEEQITLTFDLPFNSQPQEEVSEEKEEKILFGLDDDIKDLNVNEHIELIPVTEANEEGEKRYVLDDFMMSETSTKTKTIEIEPEIEEVVFERKTVEAHPVESFIVDEIDPMNSPISDLLKERADERRRKMKEFNYKFSSAKIDEIEREPAYKRQGVNLDDNKPSSDLNASRMSVGTDDNNDVQLRSNNSFLHDNVD